MERVLGRSVRTMAAVVAVGGAVVLAAPVAGAAPRGGAPSGPTCTDTWTSTSGGTWSDAADWSTGAVPGATDVACVTDPGTYTVVLDGSESAGSVVVGTSSGSGKVSVVLQGNPAQGDANLDLGNTVQVNKHGVLDLTSLGDGNVFLRGGTVDNYGTVATQAGSGWSRYIYGNVINEKGAKFTVGDTAPDWNGGTYQSSGSFSNAGTLSVAASSLYDLSNGSFTFNAGKVKVAKATKKKAAGLVQLDNVASTLVGGKATGPAVQLNGGSIVDSGGTGVYDVNNNGSLTGTVPTGQTIDVVGNGADDNRLALDGTVTNDGTIILTSAPSGLVNGPTSGGNSWLSAGTGTPGLVNGGALELLPGIGWTRYLTVPVTNGSTGTMDVQGPDNQFTAASLTNDGTVSMGAGATLTLSGTSYGPSSYTQGSTATLGVTVGDGGSSQIDQYDCSAGGCQSEGIAVAGRLQVTEQGTGGGSFEIVTSGQAGVQGAFSSVTPSGDTASYNAPEGPGVVGDVVLTTAG